MNSLLKYFTPDQVPIKVIGPNAAGTHTRVEVLVTPFGSKSKKDLHREFFDANSYFGDDTVKTKYGLYEHFMNDWNNPVMAEMGKQKQIMGPATLTKTDDAGRWFEFEIKRSLEYHDALMNLIDLKLMGASTQCLPNSKTVDGDGYISMWIESEVSLTPTPANKDTIGRVYELIGAKSADFHLPPMQYVKGGQLFELKADTDIAAEPEIIPEPETPAPITDIAQEIETLLGTPVLTEDPAPASLENLSEEAQKSIRTIVSNEVKAQMSVFIELWGSDIEEAKNAILQMMGNGKSSAEGIGTLIDRIGKLEVGILTMAKFFKDISVKGLANQTTSREQDILDPPATPAGPRLKSKVPEHLRMVSNK